MTAALSEQLRQERKTNIGEKKRDVVGVNSQYNVPTVDVSIVQVFHATKWKLAPLQGWG